MPTGGGGVGKLDLFLALLGAGGSSVAAADISLFPQAVELPDSFSPELRSLLEGLLQRDVHRRLGCLGRG